MFKFTVRTSIVMLVVIAIATPVSAQNTQPAPQSSTTLLQDAKALLNKFVDIRVRDAGTGQANVQVKAPFVNVDVKDGQRQVKVKAPFVNVDKTTGTPVAVKAPFVNVQKSNESTSVKAPFINLQRGPATTPDTADQTR